MTEPDEPEVALVRCLRVTEVERPVSGSEIRQCAECGADVWFDVALMDEVGTYSEIVYRCRQCVPRRAGADPHVRGADDMSGDQYRSGPAMGCAMWMIYCALAVLAVGWYLTGWPAVAFGAAAALLLVFATVALSHELAKPCRPVKAP